MAAFFLGFHRYFSLFLPIYSSYLCLISLAFVVNYFVFVYRVGRPVSLIFIGNDPGGCDVDLGDTSIGAIVAIRCDYR